MPRIELFPFELFDPIRKKWRRARWNATRADIEARGGRICGAAEVRDAGGGTASHVQSSPAPSGTLPSDFVDGSELVRTDLGAGSAAAAGDSASHDDPAWGTRLLP